MRCHPQIPSKKYFSIIQTHFFALKLNKSPSKYPQDTFADPLKYTSKSP